MNWLIQYSNGDSKAPKQSASENLDQILNYLEKHNGDFLPNALNIWIRDCGLRYVGTVIQTNRLDDSLETLFTSYPKIQKNNVVMLDKNDK